MNVPSIDYDQAIRNAPKDSVEAVGHFLAETLPGEWVKAYKALTPNDTHIFRIQIDNFEYIYDLPIELVRKGMADNKNAVEDRVIAAHGWSQPSSEARHDSATRGWPRGPSVVAASPRSPGYDRGHFIGHSLGGSLGINLFSQLSELNRGWSEDGKVFRSMERYCEKHPGTYCFVRPAYIGQSAHPSALEYGVLKENGELWVRSFQNTATPEEMSEIERLLNENLDGEV